MTAAAPPSLMDRHSSASDPTIESARRVLGLEANALLALAATLDRDFLQAVKRIGSVEGRLIVTGMGKSGLVGRKIAATFASTGTPALFVHPAEASHGDLGMIATDDLILALSNSGETPELANIVAYSRRFSIPLLAVTGKVNSTLATSADLVLSLPDLPEACPMGLAPTTSTTAMLALGDALAIALLERRGFGADDFGRLHPGGKLGQRLVRVSELMHGGDALPIIDEQATMADAMIEMTAKRFGCVGVLDGQSRLKGVVTDGDVRRHMAPDLLQRSVAEIMTETPRTIRPQALAAEALALMNQADRPFTALFVVEDERPLGILHMHDCLRSRVV